ncbi:hypothetical protein LTR62_003960 [Meristemomyces frigidus]|uniref:Uncharacterized protein n=1 Tax=Meristemomyces frigidus TaxID=1508187 RepID=A0AAN7TI75_9PEZI|nr:hypothetical protein LTR62_003960 [Meristemomyces frigidus]
MDYDDFFNNAWTHGVGENDELLDAPSPSQDFEMPLASHATSSQHHAPTALMSHLQASAHMLQQSLLQSDPVPTFDQLPAIQTSPFNQIPVAGQSTAVSTNLHHVPQDLHDPWTEILGGNLANCELNFVLADGQPVTNTIRYLFFWHPELREVILETCKPFMTQTATSQTSQGTAQLTAAPTFPAPVPTAFGSSLQDTSAYAHQSGPAAEDEEMPDVLPDDGPSSSAGHASNDLNKEALNGEAFNDIAFEDEPFNDEASNDEDSPLSDHNGAADSDDDAEHELETGDEGEEELDQPFDYVSDFIDADAARLYLANSDPAEFTSLEIDNDDVEAMRLLMHEYAARLYAAIQVPGRTDEASFGKPISAKNPQFRNRLIAKFAEQQVKTAAKIKAQLSTESGRKAARARCVIAFEAVLFLHTIGMPKESYNVATIPPLPTNKAKRVMVDLESICSKRLDDLVEVVRASKLVAWDVLTGYEVAEKVWHPVYAREKKAGYLESNVRRQMTINDTKAAAAAKKASEDDEGGKKGKGKGKRALAVAEEDGGEIVKAGPSKRRGTVAKKPMEAEEAEEEMEVEEEVIVPPKRGRGRPRKLAPKE